MKAPTIHVVRFMIPPWAYGQAWGHLILLRQRALDEYAWWVPRAIAHELVHYDQWARYGRIGFLWRYVWGWASNGFRYIHNPLELEAWAKEGTREYMDRAGVLLHEHDMLER